MHVFFSFISFSTFSKHRYIVKEVNEERFFRVKKNRGISSYSACCFSNFDSLPIQMKKEKKIHPISNSISKAETRNGIGLNSIDHERAADLLVGRQGGEIGAVIGYSIPLTSFRITLQFVVSFIEFVKF